VVEAVRTLLDRPKIADMVIPDLARWEDWSVMERLVQMFKDADEETSWLRVPIASYLRACPKPAAKEYIAELQKIDPDAIKRADFFLNFDEDPGDDDDDADASTETESGIRGGDADTDSVDGASRVSYEISDGMSQKTYVSRRPPLVDESFSQPVQSENAAPDSEADSNSGPMASVSDNSPAIAQTSRSDAGDVTALDDGNLMPIAAVEVASVPVWQLILIPLVCSIVIFCLLWSVITGWFDRLIY
jgi:hypothetical protein